MEVASHIEKKYSSIAIDLGFVRYFAFAIWFWLLFFSEFRAKTVKFQTTTAYVKLNALIVCV